MIYTTLGYIVSQILLNLGQVFHFRIVSRMCLLEEAFLLLSRSFTTTTTSLTFLRPANTITSVLSGATLNSLPSIQFVTLTGAIFALSCGTHVDIKICVTNVRGVVYVSEQISRRCNRLRRRNVKKFQ